MRVLKCSYCGRGRKLTHVTSGYIRGVDVLTESDRFPSVRLHFSCAAAVREKAASYIGKEVLENLLMDELKVPWKELPRA